MTFEPPNSDDFQNGADSLFADTTRPCMSATHVAKRNSMHPKAVGRSARREPSETGRSSALFRMAQRNSHANVNLFSHWLLRGLGSCSRLSRIRLWSYRDGHRPIASVLNCDVRGTASQSIPALNSAPSPAHGPSETTRLSRSGVWFCATLCCQNSQPTPSCIDVVWRGRRATFRERSAAVGRCRINSPAVCI
jgi:hypothetical protein